MTQAICPECEKEVVCGPIMRSTGVCIDCTKRRDRMMLMIVASALLGFVAIVGLVAYAAGG